MSTLILALESATEACSAALWIDGAVESRYQVTPNQHTQHMLPMVLQLLSQAEISLNALDAVAFSQGPGSFTGVRIATAVAQGLALGIDRPLIGISTLLAMAQGAYRLQSTQQVVAAIDARMQQLYWGSYQRHADEWHQYSPEALLTPSEASVSLSTHLGHWIGVGTGWRAYPQLLPEKLAAGDSVVEKTPRLSIMIGDLLFPHAQDLLPLAAVAWKRGEVTSAAQARPCYLRNNIALKRPLPSIQSSGNHIE